MKAIDRHLLASLALAALASSCVPFPHADRLAGQMTGHVIDGARQPISGARIEYLYHGTHVVGKTTSREDGSFDFGPFRQWFYLIYVGSPGVVPFPFWLEHPGFPDLVRVSQGAATAVYIRGSQEDFETRVPLAMRPGKLYSPARWLPDGQPIILGSEMRDPDPPGCPSR